MPEDIIASIQRCVRNTLKPSLAESKQIAAVIGDTPSHYSKSPALWNAAFRAFKMDAVYLPFDVDQPQLAPLVRVLKSSDRVIGASVTVPHKMKIMEYLDEVDDDAKKMKAVNTIIRTRAGRLLGANTDGAGFLDSILRPQPGQPRPFVKSLKEMSVLVLGAGGSARAVAFAVAKKMEHGQLLICNRTFETAFSLAEEVKPLLPTARAIREDEIGLWAEKVRLIVNCTTKGQGGLRKVSNAKMTSFEPYSALAPARSAAIPEPVADEAEFYRKWLDASLADIESNNHASLKLVLSIPPETAFCDLVYFPEETTFLRHGRMSGHPTLNGKAMMVAQAVVAFMDKVCRSQIEARGLNTAKTHARLLQVMHKAW